MIPLTESQIRTSFVNASKGDAKRARLPDLAAVDWDRLDLLGWQDAKRPTLHYVSLELDGEVATLMLRGAERPPAKKMLCSWCEDIVDGNRAAIFVAPLGGDAGRRGNTVGTSICADLGCSRNVRRAPAPYEVRSQDPALLAYHQEQKIAGLRERSSRFVRTVTAG
ncbi:MAG: FBP domain-containing protein [Brachybacterium sp.]|uniref:FBP domain-containing protein n=1 Tax=Brachybacterium sp. TaxID=1891286 RepID=UPI0026557840|nr:FBP domain-containing protein [Brachybacterium sp.]MDN6328737.1 FBP domain-containing protein [Brachybacterium sp.]